MSWGPCIGDILPAAEDCATPTFESCVPNTCEVWTKRISVNAGSVVLGAGAGLVVASAMNSFTNGLDPVDFGNGVQLGSIPPGQDGYQNARWLVGMHAHGDEALWAHRFTGFHLASKRPGNVTPTKILVDGQGRAAIIGWAGAGPVHLDDDVLFSGGWDNDGFIMRFEADGSAGWWIRDGFTDHNDSGGYWDRFWDAALSTDGTIWATGEAPAHGGPLQIMYGTFAADGQGSVVKGHGSLIETNTSTAIAANVAGHVAMFEKGHGTLACSFSVPQGSYLRRAAPACLATSLPYAQADLAMDEEGDVYVLGDVPPTLERRDLTNQIVWSVPVPVLGKLAFSPSGELYLYGTFSGTSDFGQGNVTSAGGTDLFIVRYDLDGDLLGVHTFGGTGNEVAHDIAIDELGQVFIAGTSTGNVDFGVGTTVATAPLDAFIAKVLL